MHDTPSLSWGQKISIRFEHTSSLYILLHSPDIEKDHSSSTLELCLPANTTPAATSLRLWIVNDAEAAADELRCIIDRGALQKARGHGIDYNGSRPMSGVSELTASRSELMGPHRRRDGRSRRTSRREPAER